MKGIDKEKGWWTMLLKRIWLIDDDYVERKEGEELKRDCCMRIYVFHDWILPNPWSKVRIFLEFIKMELNLDFSCLHTYVKRGTHHFIQVNSIYHLNTFF